MYKNQELRKLPTGSLNRINETLETNGDWRKVMSRIPKDLTSDKYEPKYTNEQIRAIEEYSKIMKKPCAEVLFDEWGTSGRIRPTLGVLQNLVLQAGVYKAADEIALMLQEPLPPRPNTGPAAKIDTCNLTRLLNDDSNKHGKKRSQTTESTAQMKSSFPSFSKFNILKTNKKTIENRTTASVRSEVDFESSTDYNTYEYSTSYSEKPSMSANIPNLDILIGNHTNNSKPSEYSEMQYPAPPFKIDTTILENKTLTQFDYDELRDITCDFSNVFIYGPMGPTGKIGSGGFGDVYAGLHSKHGLLAVKKFRNLNLFSDKPDLVSQTFNAEVKCLAQLRNENIVPIIGYSLQERTSLFPSLCIVCQYIEGGSLEQNLAAKRLTGEQRMTIIVGTAKGLRYIHNRDTGNERPLENGVGDSYMHYIHGDVKSANILLTRDFQPKLCDFGLAKQFNSTLVTPSVMGTTPYMSPERLRGTITQKADIYSYGIVLLEILTGFQSLVQRNREIINLQDHVNEKLQNGELKDVLDDVVKSWDKAGEVYELAKKCLQYEYGHRPSIDKVCEELVHITSEHPIGVIPENSADSEQPIDIIPEVSIDEQ